LDTFDFWLTKSENNKPIWTQTLCLSQNYFENLQKHAVPLSEHVLATLSNSAMALDIYAWIAQRLHRMLPGKPQFIPWMAVKEQFGSEYRQMIHFKHKFRIALSKVLACYQKARIEVNHNGLTLKQSPPPNGCFLRALLPCKTIMITGNHKTPITPSLESSQRTSQKLPATPQTPTSIISDHE